MTTPLHLRLAPVALPADLKVGRYIGLRLLVGVDAVGGDFDFSDPAEGKEQLYEVLGRLLRSLLHNMCDSVGDRGLEHHTLGLEAGQIHAHELAWLQHRLLYGNPPPARREMQADPDDSGKTNSSAAEAARRRKPLCRSSRQESGQAPLRPPSPGRDHSGQADADRLGRFLHCKNLYHFAVAFFCSGGLMLLGSGLSTGNMLSIFGNRANHTSPSPLEGFGIFRAQKTDSELRQIARREWWLWLSAVFVTAFSAVAFLLSTFPRLFLHSEHFYEIRSDQARWGVLCLLLLFNGRLVYRQWEFRRRRMELTGQGTGAQGHAEQINDPTTVDPVTGLYTRAFIEQQLGKEIARARRQNTALSLATIHLDDFAEISKQYGAAARDQAVKDLAQRLKRACRGSDFAVRLGSDDFLLVLPECNLGEAKVVLNRVGPLETTCSGRKITLGYTTGWVDYQQGDMPSDLLKRAAELLHLYDTAAKESFASTPLPH